MKTVLICHDDDELNRLALPRWLASFSELVGIVSISEKRVQKRDRIRREIKRVGRARFADVLAFRVYHKLFVLRGDQAYERELLTSLFIKYPALPPALPILKTSSPNSPETREFLAGLAPDLVIARCKVILKPEIFQIPRTGTFVMHPGVCPEYRNAHGCFWALAEGDLAKVGMTLLKVDKGIDTGPVYGYYSYPYDEQRESHIRIQHRTVFDNLDPLRDKLLEVHAGRAIALDTHGRPSTNWGQPWLSRYLRWKRRAAKRGRRQISLLYHDVLLTGMVPAASGFVGADADIYKLKQCLFSEHLKKISEIAGRVGVLTEPALPWTAQAPVLFTFDDGGVTADEPTARLLEERGWRGHFYIVTERMDQPGFLTRAQIRDLDRRGHVIGSHSHSHPAGFSRLSHERMVHEWKHSRELLEALLGKPVWSASVPGGFYSRDVARAAAEAGYRVLYNSEPNAEPEQVEGLLVLGRYGIQHETSAENALCLAGADFGPRFLQRARWNAKKPLKKLGGPMWLAFRRWFFK